MNNVNEIKGNLHLYEVDIEQFTEFALKCLFFDNGIDLKFYCGQKLDNLNDVKIKCQDFLEVYKNSEVRVEGSVVVHFDKLEE